jgi:hypothetical protein
MMRNWNRREFTRNVAMLTLFSPFIRLLEPSVARAQAAATGPAKYLLIVVSNGSDPSLLQPNGNNPFAQAALSPLAQIANDAFFLNQFDSKGTAGNHGAPGGLSAAQYIQRESLDNFVAGDLRKRGILTQVPSLHLGGVKGQQGISFRNNGLQVPQFEVSEAFRTIFDGTAPPPPVATPETPNAPAAPAGPSDTTIRLLRRQSVLDAVKNDVTQLERAFNGLEKEKLELHIASIRELETRIGQQLSISQGQTATPVGGGGTTAPAPAFISPVSCAQPNNRAGDQPITNSGIHLELATAAFACDITRVALVEFGHHQSCPVNIPGAQGDWHNDFMHASTDRSRLIVTEQFMSTQIVNTVNRLKTLQAPDGNGTLYDQTFILWAREMGDAVVHAGTNMPFVVSGGAGGYLRNGNAYLNGGGAFHLRVLMNAAEAMGARDLSGFGDPNAGGADRTPFDGLKG